MHSSFEKPCIVGKNVADFFMAKLDADHSESHASQRIQLLQFQTWLSGLMSQVCEWVPQCAHDKHDPQLIITADLLKLLLSFKSAAWATYQADIKACGHAKVVSMRGLHDAVLHVWLVTAEARQHVHNVHACALDDGATPCHDWMGGSPTSTEPSRSTCLAWFMVTHARTVQSLLLLVVMPC